MQFSPLESAKLHDVLPLSPTERVCSGEKVTLKKKQGGARGTREPSGAGGMTDHSGVGGAMNYGGTDR